jgi:hypothetical protein
MYPLGLQPIGLILREYISSVRTLGSCLTSVSSDTRRRASHKLTRILAWLALFSILFALELSHAGPPQADDARAYKTSALVSLMLFLFLPDWMLTTLLAALACYMVWHALTSNSLTAGAAMVVIGISPVLALLFACSTQSQAAGRRNRPNWLAEDPFFDFCGRRR